MPIRVNMKTFFLFLFLYVLSMVSALEEPRPTEVDESLLGNVSVEGEVWVRSPVKPLLLRKTSYQFSANRSRHVQRLRLQPHFFPKDIASPKAPRFPIRPKDGMQNVAVTPLVRYRLLTPDWANRPRESLSEVGFEKSGQSARAFTKKVERQRSRVPDGVPSLKFDSVRAEEAWDPHINVLRKGIVSYPIVRHKGSALLQPVRIKCGDQTMRVEVDLAFFESGDSGQMRDVLLGPDCLPNGKSASSSRTVIFIYKHHECGSKRTVTETELIYSNFIHYKSPLNADTGAPSVKVECRYSRLTSVSTQNVKPTWKTLTSTRSSKTGFAFSFKLMSSNFVSESLSNVYYLGEFIYFQVSVDLGNHQHLKLYIDSCVATTTRHINSKPIYHIIQDYGCLVDSRTENSFSTFVSPRTNEVLRFQMKAFQFEDHPADQIFIHCHVKLSEDSSEPNEYLKSCTFNPVTEMWEELEGWSQACDCCEMRCGRTPRNKRVVGFANFSQLDTNLIVGPLQITKPNGSSNLILSSGGNHENHTLWSHIREHLEGTFNMGIIQIFAIAAAMLSALGFLIGVLCLCSLKSKPSSKT
ncbi:uncharacterized protein LOC114648965 [Erpetoichthys calabaricus]|uniref:Zona pellucida sperm-binding protein 3 n=1 Tax=Erpetoichthys calabaricus TaxID=27687 RepID=A0A8C4SDH1_ERPCA|nr:uncharacterized protein LOC114648965 [Erpetoichthys calabaricus]